MSSTTQDTDLQQRLTERAAGFSGQFGMFAKNLETSAETGLNPDAVMPTASVIKVAVLAELYRQAQTEVRLLAETYLDGTDVSFSPAELRDLIELSAAHPAYVQRAAFYLFQSKLDAAFDWRAAYRAEVRDRPVPGAPLPAAVFEGGGPSQIQRSSYGDTAEARAAQPQQLRPLPEMPPLVNMLVAVAAALLGYLASGSWPIALVLGLVAVVAYTLWARPRRAP